MKETEIYLQFLVHIAASDGHACSEEIQYIESCMDSMGISDVVQTRITQFIEAAKNKQPVDLLDNVISALKDSDNLSLLMTLIRDGYAMASADGNVDEPELNQIKRLMHAFHPEDDDFFSEIISWSKESLRVKSIGEDICGKLMGVEAL